MFSCITMKQWKSTVSFFLSLPFPIAHGQGGPYLRLGSQPRPAGLGYVLFFVPASSSPRKVIGSRAMGGSSHLSLWRRLAARVCFSLASWVSLRVCSGLFFLGGI